MFDDFRNSWLIIALAIITLIAWITNDYFFNNEKTKHSLTWILGIMLIIPFMKTNDFIVLFTSLIGFSLAVYTLLISDYKKHVAREAAIKYFYLSAISVTLILFGIIINYTIVETTDFVVTAKNLELLAQKEELPVEILSIMLIFLMLGFFFKLAAYPGHLWAADVYEGAPRPAFAFFVLPAKIVMLVVFTTLVVRVYEQMHTLSEPLLFLAAVGSLVWGALAAVYERKIKRFIAYTSINQMGFLLMALVINGSNNDNYKYMLVYLMVYAIMTLNLLMVYLQTRPQIVYITDLNALQKYNPFIGMVLTFTMFAMAGIPPLAGFWGKYYVLVAAFKANYMFILKIVLAISMISTFYYIRIIKIMLFEKLKLSKIYVAKPSLLFLIIINILLGTFVFLTDSVI